MPKVMLIDDDPTMLSLLTTLLTMEGFQTAKFTVEQTVEELISTIRREKPDLAMVDVHLHNFNGIELLTRMRQEADLSAIKILMCSGLDLSAECQEAGADDFILKPYMPDDLIQKIRRVTN